MRAVPIALMTLSALVIACATSHVDTIDPGETAPPPAKDPESTTEPSELPSLQGDASTTARGDAAIARDSGSRSDGGAGRESGGNDSGGGTFDAAGDATLTCAPGNVSGFSPTWKPSKTNLLACLPADVDAFYTACLGPTSTQQTCQSFATSKASCYSCIVTFDTDAQWGPLVVFSAGPLSLNLGGCVDVMSSSSGTCARSLQAEAQCEHLACDAPCASASDTDYDACVTSASQGGCSTYASGVSTQCASLPASAAPCAQGSTFEARFKSVARVFCTF
jgi:hypothetical protein